MPDEELGKAVGLGAKKLSAGDFSKGGDTLLKGFIHDEEEKQGSDEERGLIGAHVQQSADVQVCTPTPTNSILFRIRISCWSSRLLCVVLKLFSSLC